MCQKIEKFNTQLQMMENQEKYENDPGKKKELQEKIKLIKTIFYCQNIALTDQELLRNINKSYEIYFDFILS